ncbi:hypothetical protein F5Y19DRAFT_469996 [Xylariaceae sp. FL1651]|nr:hypothetical protein F5Y19DRAFT_469996 [Xylariaceae sp. FL1651]
MLSFYVASLLLQGAACLSMFAEQPRKHIIGTELSQFNFTPYNLPDMYVECHKDEPADPMFNCSIKFDWNDPNANNSACVCESRWLWDGFTMAPGPQNSYSTDYFVCNTENKEYFQFKFNTMTGISRFNLILSHTFLDTKCVYGAYKMFGVFNYLTILCRDFPSPERANLFGQANFTLRAEKRTNTSMIYVIPRPQKVMIVGVTI